MTRTCWLEQTEAEVAAGNDWLSEGESHRLSDMRFAKRRSEWRLGRWTAKRAVAAWLHWPGDARSLARIEIRSAPSGAPEVFLDGQPPEVSISLSHRAGTAICAAASAGAALGCDLELIEPRSFAFIADYFTVAEQVLVSRVSVIARPRLTALIWSAKESALKALSAGLRLDTRSVDVRLYSDISRCGPHGRDVWRPLQVHCAGGRSFEGWWQQTTNFLLTLVADPSPLAPIRLEIPACGI